MRDRWVRIIIENLLEFMYIFVKRVSDYVLINVGDVTEHLCVLEIIKYVIGGKVLYGAS
jgi:hypothetical protein